MPRRNFLTVKNDVLHELDPEVAPAVAGCLKALPSGSMKTDPRLVAAQVLLLLGKKREAIVILDELDNDTVAKNAFSHAIFASGDTMDQIFTVKGEPYRYFISLYNHTWRNERIVEIPVAAAIMRENRGSMLEIGNVLSHYFSSGHTVIDKYEKNPGVINVDIADYTPSERFDAIVAISTLEHIGHDKVRDDNKVIRAYDHIVNNCMSARGVFLFTVPVGFNPVIDGHIDAGRIRPDEYFCLKRISQENDWVEVGWNEVRTCKYMDPFHCANGLYFGITYGKEHPQKLQPAATTEVTENKSVSPIKSGGPSKGRVESNAWIRKAAAGLSGNVLSIGSRDDRDGEGGFYRSYFTAASSYTTSDICGAVDLELDVRRMSSIADNRFAVIFCSGVLEHVDDFQAGLSEITRILAPGGTLLLGLPFRQAIHDAPLDFWRFTKYGAEYLLKKKYDILEIREIDTAENNFPVAYWIKAVKR